MSFFYKQGDQLRTLSKKNLNNAVEDSCDEGEEGLKGRWWGGKIRF